MQPHLGPVIGGAVELLRKGPIHVGRLGDAIAGRHLRGPVIVDRIQDLLQVIRVARPNLDTHVTGVLLALADLDFLQRVVAAVRQDFVEHLGQQQRVDDVPLQFDFFDELGARFVRGHSLLQCHLSLVISHLSLVICQDIVESSNC